MLPVVVPEASWEPSGFTAATAASRPAEDGPLAFVCGPTSFVESVAAGLVELGYAPGRVKTERFGATGER